MNIRIVIKKNNKAEGYIGSLPMPEGVNKAQAQFISVNLNALLAEMHGNGQLESMFATVEVEA